MYGVNGTCTHQYLLINLLPSFMHERSLNRNYVELNAFLEILRD